MNKLKERVFGLIVVIALGVIFVPMLLENTQNPKSNVLQDVPAASLAKNNIDKDQKPAVLAELKNEKIEKPVVYDERQPIADRSNEKQPGLQEDLKAKEKVQAIEEEKAEQEKVAQEKAAQDKAQQQKIEQATAQAKFDQDKRQREDAERVKAQIQATKTDQTKAEQAKIAQVKAEQAQFLKEKNAMAKTEPVKETPKSHAVKISKPIQHGWVVQMGSFAEPHNASALLKKLKKAGYPAFTRNVYRQDMDLTIVMVGPHTRREDADRLNSTLSMKFQIDGIIVRYEPH